MKRRSFLLGTAAIAAAGVFLKPDDKGQAYDKYFSALNAELKENGDYVPTMLVDLDKVDTNIQTLKQQLNPNTDLRVVAKSLPSPELLGYVMERANTNKLMVFHQPFINEVAEQFPSSDLLLGKPIPVKAVHRFYRIWATQDTNFNPEQQLQWLIDTPERAKQYLALAKQLGQKLLLNIELDVGLHRGGLKTTEELDTILDLVEANQEHIEFTGFMGYDPHVVKLPSIVKSAEQAYIESQATYQMFLTHLYQQQPKYRGKPLTLNGAGSPTIAMHNVKTVCNELSAGSCLVKPSDFDLPALASYQAAAFIATPVLKKINGTELPAAEVAKEAFAWWDPNMEQTFFIYGGKWMADYESPQGLQGNGLFGTSTNQQIVNGSYKVALSVDDYVFLRPHQSEFVFLQFGDLLAVKAGHIVSRWPILKQV